jgi:hypothetical protein
MKILPTVPELAHSTLVTLGGLLLAAFILSRFPKVGAFVAGQSLTVKDGSGKTIYY